MRPGSTNSPQLLWARYNILWGGGARRRLWLKLAKLLESGVPISKALQTMRERRVRLTSKDDPLAMALAEWSGHLLNGRRFAEAVTGWLPNQERMLIAAGERAGTLPGTLQSAARIIEAQSNIRAAVIGGVAYPAVLIALTVGIFYLFGFKIVPAFSRIIPEDRWQGLAASMVVMSKAVQTWMPFFVAGLLALIGAFFWSLDKWDGKARVFLDRFPPYSTYRMIVGSTWLIAFAALVEAGERVENALEQLKRHGGRWLTRRIDGCLRGMRSGHNVGEALNLARTGFPDPEIIDDIAVYSSLSGFNEALAMIGKEWLTESVEQIRAGMRVLFSLSIVLVASVLAYMVSGLFAMQLQMGLVLQNTAR